jgi:phenylacetyl-CoA:acceptor oxidoreductase subunit 2
VSRKDKVIDRVAPRLQTNWDIRGALNFIFGGQGAGLLVATACATTLPLDLRLLVALALAFIGAGLFCVWLKIGRPWRALHVFRRPTTSWMSREAWIAPIIFALGAAVVILESRAAAVALGPLGLIYAYAQGRILKANIGIPAWRRWSCVAMIVATALVEGFAILLLAALVWPALMSFAWLLAGLIGVRYLAWRFYRSDLDKAGAPMATLDVLGKLNVRFTLIGHVAAAVFVIAGAWSGQPLLVGLGAGLAFIEGALFKYVLVCRAAFFQGFALPKMPSRGKGPPSDGVRPGWRQEAGPGA